MTIRTLDRGPRPFVADAQSLQKLGQPTQSRDAQPVTDLTQAFQCPATLEKAKLRRFTTDDVQDRFAGRLRFLVLRGKTRACARDPA